MMVLSGMRKSLADKYHQAIKCLNKAEASHRTNLDHLQQAREARNAAMITPLRRDAEKTERGLDDALRAAHAAFRAYWASRRDALEPEMEKIASVLAEYDALARLAGDMSQRPAMQRLYTLALAGYNAQTLLDQGALFEQDGVPADEPDSELLEDMRGCWK